MPENCPQCGREPLNHDAFTCNFTYIYDELNHKYTWIPGPDQLDDEIDN